MNNFTTSEMLDLAADEIQRRGWTQGPNGWSSTGPVCLEGAIAAVSGVRTVDLGEQVMYSTMGIEECPAFLAVRDYLGFRPFAFNDRAESVEDVIAVLRAAAAVERAKEAAYAPEKVAA